MKTCMGYTENGMNQGKLEEKKIIKMENYMGYTEHGMNQDKYMKNIII